METAKLAAFRNRALDILFPPQCLCCQALVAETGSLCSDCWQNISFIAGPCCHACGLPFEFELGPEALCGACAQDRPVFNRARSVMIYNAASRDLILSFKHGDRTHAAAAYAGWLKRSGSDLIRHSDLILPVPLHWSRLFHRRYNQAALLAIELGKLTGLPVDTDSLIRHKKTASQGHKSPSQRLSNLRGAFSVSAQSEQKVKDKHVLLIDDVLTTGATAKVCAKTLFNAGACNVDVLTLARVVRTETSNIVSSLSGHGLLTDI
ncbi:MAG: ComF family protein [Rhodospirillaceae bacterium]|jgi:ComF family protein|nr:ComF family protein [Rhodospirillaceae bacterium]